MTESMVLLVLGACWAGYLAWYWRESHRNSTDRSDRIRSFATDLGALGGSTARVPGALSAQSLSSPRGRNAAARRRREVLIGLGVVCVITFLAAVTLGAMAILVHIVADLAFAGYGYAVIQRRNIAAEREMKVHMLYPDRRLNAAPAATQAANG